jgi:sterol 3beta-glucosyltransferase
MQCPTTIIPFFGDQFFWGERIHAKGVGPSPIPISELTVERLCSAFKFMLEPEVICFFLTNILKIEFHNMARL